MGKVKSIFDDRGIVLNQAEVPLPVEIMGFDEVPEAGELFQVIDDIEKARKVVDSRKQEGKEAKKGEALQGKKLSLQNLFERLEEDKNKDGVITESERKREVKRVVRLVGVDVENLAQAGGGATTGIETLVDLDIDPSTKYGQAVLSQLSLALKNTYGLSLEDLQNEAFNVDLREVPIRQVNEEQQRLNGGAQPASTPGKLNG